MESPIQALNQYQRVGKPIWVTNYSTVYKVKTVKQVQESIYAMKVIKYRPVNTVGRRNNNLIEKKLIEMEINKYLEIIHPNLIKIKQWFDNQEEEEISIIMQYCEGSLQQIIESNILLQPQTLKKYIIQIAEALKYLHEQKGIIHRDLKPQNILLSNNSIKIIDLGIAKSLQNQVAYNSFSERGTPQYYAPEIQHLNHYNYQIDIWALGIITLQLLTAKRIRKLVKGVNNIQKLIPFKSQGFPENQLKLIDNIEMRYLVERMLKKEPLIRITTNQIIQRLKIESEQNLQREQKQLLCQYINELERKILKLYQSNQQKQFKIVNIAKSTQTTLQIEQLISKQAKYCEQYQNNQSKLNQQIKINHILEEKNNKLSFQQQNLQKQVKEKKQQILRLKNTNQILVQQNQKIDKQIKQRDSIILKLKLDLQNQIIKCQQLLNKFTILENDKFIPLDKQQAKKQNIAQQLGKEIIKRNDLQQKKLFNRINIKQQQVIQNNQFNKNQINHLTIQEKLIEIAKQKKWNQITQWVKNQKQLKQLKKLRLQKNMQKINDQIKCLTGLTQLQLINSNIQKMQNLETFVNLTTLYLSSYINILDDNIIKKIENLQTLVKLNWLWLYNNQIEKIENLQSQALLGQLSLGIDWVNLARNKIKKIQKLQNHNQLTFLSLRSNQIRKIQNLQTLVKLSNLYLGSNQIQKIQNLQKLNRLTLLQLQNNKIQIIENLQTLNMLTNLKLQKNYIKKIQNLEKLTKLKMLNLNDNQIVKIQNLQQLTKLNQLGLQSNKIEIIQNISTLTLLKSINIKNNLLLIDDINKQAYLGLVNQNIKVTVSVDLQ